MTTDARYMQPSRDESIPRGIRNCNPLNVERKGDSWLGMVRDQSGDERFIIFESPVYGFRCPAKLLLNYQADKPHTNPPQRGLRTVNEMVNRWAPPSENVTSAYVVAVANAMAVGFDQPVDLRNDPELFARMLRAMCKHENGVPCPYDDDVIFEGMKLAGVKVVTPREPSVFASGFDQDISQ
jgi:hypothetical protein